MLSFRLRTRWSILLCYALGAIFSLPRAEATTRYVFEGYLVVDGNEADYALLTGPGGAALAGVNDPDGGLDFRAQSRVRFTGELTTARTTADLPIVQVRTSGSAAWASPSGPSAGADAGRWAGRDNGLYPSLDEPMPRSFVASGGGGGTPTDSDGDGIPDASDAFPDDPAEWLDTDGDGIGNNADPDDDDDGMTDEYEELNGLDSLVDDAAGDLDHDLFLNGDEFVAGTAANDPLSWFRVTSTILNAGAWAISWKVEQGRLYDLYVSDDGLKFVLLRADLSPKVGQTVMGFKFAVPADREPGMFRVRVRLAPTP